MTDDHTPYLTAFYRAAIHREQEERREALLLRLATAAHALAHAYDDFDPMDDNDGWKDERWNDP